MYSHHKFFGMSDVDSMLSESSDCASPGVISTGTPEQIPNNSLLTLPSSPPAQNAISQTQDGDTKAKKYPDLSVGHTRARSDPSCPMLDKVTSSELQLKSSALNIWNNTIKVADNPSAYQSRSEGFPNSYPTLPKPVDDPTTMSIIQRNWRQAVSEPLQTAVGPVILQACSRPWVKSYVSPVHLHSGSEDTHGGVMSAHTQAFSKQQSGHHSKPLDRAAAQQADNNASLFHTTAGLATEDRDAHGRLTAQGITSIEPSRVFRPMEATMQHGSAGGQGSMTPTLQEIYTRMTLGFSPNYRGNINLPRNRSANIPSYLNCSLFIKGLPPALTTQQLIASIRNVGRVYATSINPPELGKGYATCAAKVIFFDRQSAERLYNQCLANGGFRVTGYPHHVGYIVWNRIQSAAHVGPRHQTRVLQISGPNHLVNQPWLLGYFQSKIEFQIDVIIDRAESQQHGRRLIEIRFGSFRCQAEAVKAALSMEYSDQGVKVWYGPDPCDVYNSQAHHTLGDVGDA